MYHCAMQIRMQKFTLSLREMGIVLLACLAITQILYKEINCPREKEMCCRATTSANQGTIDTISECVIGVKSFCKNLFIE